MQFKNLSLRPIIFKLFVFIAIFYAFMLSISLITVGYLFINLPRYTTKIEKMLLTHTGYTLTIGKVNTGLTKYYLPQITITNAQVYNPKDTSQKINIKKIQFTLSYASIWYLTPIFNQINMSGTNLNFIYTKNNELLLNKINLTNFIKSNDNNPKKNHFDIEHWLLKQDRIILSNINISFLDNKNNLPKIQLYNIGLILQNHILRRHSIVFSLGRNKDTNEQMLDGLLVWSGNKFTQFDKWKQADLKIQSYNSNAFSRSLQQYIPNSGLLSQIDTNTAISGQIKAGKLQYLYINFNINNLHDAILHKQNLINLPQIGGKVQINLVNNNHYVLQVQNLTISTTTGNIMTNKNILGNYTVGQSGDISIRNTNLSNLNNLFSIFYNTNKVSISGNLDIAKFLWQGTLLKPSNYTFLASFKNFAISSKELSIPSINNISGAVILSKESGTLNLTLKNSTLLYPYIFLRPYNFKTMNSRLSWNQNKDKTLTIILEPTTFKTEDFSGNVYGKYIHTVGTTGYLDLKAHVNKILANKVGDYLPISISMPVHKWLNNGIVGGYGQNANLTFQGDLSNFPFKDGKGKFYIDADITQGKLNYVKDWPSLEGINGKFHIRNQKISIEATSAIISGNKIESAVVIIPDMTSQNVYLTADGVASGKTPNFMTYLQQTPINNIIAKLPEKSITTGDGHLEIHLNVSFKDPKHTTVNGNYDFINNTISFDLPVPPLYYVNGRLKFNERGIEINDIKASTLNSNTILTATTPKDGIMHFKIISPNLDYYQTAQYYLPFLQTVISGNSPTIITFNIDKKNGVNQIIAKSNLYGVNISAPAPFNKPPQNPINLNFVMQAIGNHSGFNINYTYGSLLLGNTVLNNKGHNQQTLIAIGTNFLPNKYFNSPKILVALNTPNIDAGKWLSTISTILTQPKSQVLETATSKQNKNKTNTHKESVGVFPIEILLNTPNVNIGSRSFPATNADVLVLKDITIFNINSTLSNGYGTFTHANKQLNLYLNELNILDAVGDIKNHKNQLVANNESTNHSTIQTNESLGYKEMYMTQQSSFESNIEKEFAVLHHVSNPKMSPNNTQFPQINAIINELYYENIHIARLSIQIKQSGNDLLIESGEISSLVTQTKFHGANYCFECSNGKSFVEMVFDVKIKDLGKLLEDLHLGQVVAKGNGTINGMLQWNGTFKDFKLANTIGTLNVNLENGKFLKANTGSIFGEILGIINLQSIVNFTHLDFSEAFANGFYFTTLKIRAYLLHNKIDIKSLYIAGPLAIVRLYGIIDINNDNINAYLIVTPKLGIGVAVGVGIITVSPLIGIATYLAEVALDEPFNKLFTFDYHITGPIKQPMLTRVTISQQIIDNLNSTIRKGNVTYDK